MRVGVPCLLCMGKVARALLSLKVILSLACACAVAAAAVPAWLLTYDAGVQAVNNLLHTFQTQVIPLISLTIRNRLTSVQGMVMWGKHNFRVGVFTVGTPEVFLEQSWNILSSTEFFNDYWYDADGSTSCLVGYLKNPHPAYTSVWLCDMATLNQTEWFCDDSGHPVELMWWSYTNESGSAFTLEQFDGHDPAVAEWVSPYLWSGRFWLSFATGIHLADGTYLGQLSADLMLGFMDDVLQNLNLTRGSSIYLIDALGNHLVSTFPSLEVTTCIGGVRVDCSDGTAEEVPWTQLGDPVLMGVAQLVQDRYGGWSRVRDEYLDFTGTGDAHFIAVLSVINLRRLRWVVAGVINVDVVLEPVTQRNRVVLGTVLGVLFGVMLVVVVYTYVVLRPLSALARQAGLLSNMHVEQVQALPGSWVTEVNVLVKAFNYLTASLTELRAYLPAHLFAVLDSKPLETSNSSPRGSPKADDASKWATASPLRSMTSFQAFASQDQMASPRRDEELSREPSSLPSKTNTCVLGETPVSARKSNVARQESRATSEGSKPQLVYGTSSTSSPGLQPQGGPSLISHTSFTLATQRSAVWRTIAVICCDFKGFHGYVSSHDPTQVSLRFQTYIQAVCECVARHGGMMDKVVGDRVFAVWNALQRCGQPELKAVQCGLAIQAQLCSGVTAKATSATLPGTTTAANVSFPMSPETRLSKLPTLPALDAQACINSSNRSSPPLSRNVTHCQADPDDHNNSADEREGACYQPGCVARVGVSTSKALCGNMGTDAMRTFVMFGDALMQAVVLQKCVAKACNASMLITEDVAKQVECNVVCCPCMVVKYPSGVVQACFEPLREVAQAPTEGEWMYQLAEQASIVQHVSELFARYKECVSEGQPYTDLEAFTRAEAAQAAVRGGGDLEERIGFISELSLLRRLHERVECYPVGMILPYLP